MKIMSGNYHQKNRNRGRQQYQNAPQKNWNEEFKEEWISDSISNQTISFCEEFGKFISRDLTTSQIRNVYGELKRIQMKGYENEKTSFLLLKPKMAYAAKRANKRGVTIFKDVFNKAYDIIDNTKKYENFMSVMEAILAYHKAFGGK